MTYTEPVTEPVKKPQTCKTCDSPIPPERLKLEGADSWYCCQDCKDIAWHKPCRISNWQKVRQAIIQTRGYHFAERTPIARAGLLHGSKI